jgi:hypothetical protein
MRRLTAVAAIATLVCELMLYVVKGNAFVTVGIGGQKAALEKTKTLARQILAKL